MHARLCLLVLLTIAGCAASKPADKPEPTAQDNIERLRKFDAALNMDRDDPIPGEAITEAFSYIADDISNDQLDAIEGYALSRGTKSVRWMLADLFVDRGRFDSAASIYVAALVDQPGEREYGMWKRWNHFFGGRPDFDHLSRQLVESLYKHFAEATPEAKIVIAELFGLPPDAAKLSPTRFRDVIEQKDKVR